MAEEFQQYFREKILDENRLFHKGNNQLFKITTQEREYLLKRYLPMQGDKWNRGEIEFRALSFLYPRGFNVPQPLNFFPEDNIATYSFEKGRVLNQEEIQEQDIRELASFLARLHKIDVKERQKFQLERTSCLSVLDYIRLIKSRYNTIIGDFRGDEKEKYFLEKRVLPEIKRLEIETLQKCPSPNKKLSIEEQVLTRGDVAFNNVLVDESGRNRKYIFHDFEYWGRDDPARPVLDFIHHDQTRNIRKSLKKLFLKEYNELADSSESFDSRIKLVSPLIGMNWVLIYLKVLSGDYLKHLKFAHEEVDAVVRERIEKAKAKLDSLNKNEY